MTFDQPGVPGGALRVQGLSKRFASLMVLHEITLEAAPGEIMALLGPSGCGKSTLLRIIAGLEIADQGTVSFDGQSLAGIPVHRRGFGLMFQDWALFPHRSVAENIGFGLRMQRLSRPAIELRVAEMLALVGLSGYGPRTIFTLSGGERQRVALARSLAPAPRLLLLDEPLGSLDRTLRERLTAELREILKDAGVTAIYVTHDQAEAFSVADRLAVMQAGQLAQVGTSAEIYRQPATPFVAQFLSLNNLVPCSEWQISDQGAWATTLLGQLRLTPDPAPPFSAEAAYVLIRPEAAQPVAPDDPRRLSGIVKRATFRGSTLRLSWEHISGVRLELDWPGDRPVALEAQLDLQLRPESLSLLAAEQLRWREINP